MAQWPSSTSAAPWPTAARSHWATSKRLCLGGPQDGRKGRTLGVGEARSMCERRDGGIPYLLQRGCCSVVRDCLELPPVPGIFKGNTEACDGPDLLQLQFFYVSLHFLLCYTLLLLTSPKLLLDPPFSPACSPTPSSSFPFLTPISLALLETF